MENLETDEEKPEEHKNHTMVWIVIILSIVSFYFLTGFFVIQPIGEIPEGMTVWYLRTGTNLPFVASADGISLKTQGSVSLLSRAIILGQAMGGIKDRVILRLPYIKALYLISTGGKEFSK